MVAINLGPIDMTLARDNEGYRDYTVTYKIQTTSPADGPQVVINCPTLPAIGSTWAFGNDLDDWVWCSPATRIAPLGRSADDGRVETWTLEQTFTNRPWGRCQDTNIENPLLEPPRVSGSFVKYVEEKTKGMDGEWFQSSSLELITGPDVEFDGNRPTINIEISSATLPLGNIASMVDTVNDANLWGLSPRKIKLSNVSWRRMVYGKCGFYYTISMEFDINFKTFDRTVADVGTQEIDPRWFWRTNPTTGNIWTPDDDINYLKEFNPFTKQWEVIETFTPAIPLKKAKRVYVKIVDDNDQPTGWHRLDGKGRMYTGADGQTQGEVELKYYPESNFLLLGIPTSF